MKEEKRHKSLTGLTLALSPAGEGRIGLDRTHRAYGSAWLLRVMASLTILFLLSWVPASAQVRVGGHVYGGGNRGKVEGNTTVTVRAGEQLNHVFGGARMADVGGRTFVNIDGEHATTDILIQSVFGGNDISGTIGATATTTVPEELTEIMPESFPEGKTADDYPEKNVIDNSWKTFVRTSRSTTIEDEKEVEHYAVIIGSLYGGGNGDFTYTDSEGNPLQDGEGNYIVKEGNTVIATRDTPFNKPDLGKTYLEIKGGCIAHLYGGGNYATVTDNTTICINNESDGLESLMKKYSDATGLSLPEIFMVLQEMTGLMTFQTNLSSYNFNFARIFGGNNKADMAIQPKWNLQKGIIRDLYSGGNEGRMTCPEGLLLDIKPAEFNNDKLFVANVYGGCRRADVRPIDAFGLDITAQNPEGYNFPTGLSARTLIRGGQITNVYGGNDISGKVYGGNAVGIYTTVFGDVYGGGNGSYAYTDNADLKDVEMFKDFYYSPNEILGLGEGAFTHAQSLEALSEFRPDAEQVSIRLRGTVDNPTIIKGSVYCGGNSASLATLKSNPMVELKIGSYVIANETYLGNNGVKMIDPAILELYAKNVDEYGNTVDSGGEDYSSLDLTDADEFASYMESVTVELLPSVVFDGDAISDGDVYEEYSSSIGSFYCGGNVGSVAVSGKNTYNFEHGLVIFDKLVAGCNNANVEAGTYNAAYYGGILGSIDERGLASGEYYTDNGEEDGNIKDRLEVNLSNLTIIPQRWNDVFAEVTSDDLTDGHLKAGETYYSSNLRSSKFTADGTEVPDETHTYYKITTVGDALEWNTARWDPDEGEFYAIGPGSIEDIGYDDSRRLLDGNVYGGCYNSGHVNGNVIININQDLLNKDWVFADTDEDGEGNISISSSGERRSGVIYDNQSLDNMAVAMVVFGGGCGAGTEIWGSTAVNLNNNSYAFMIYGGGMAGVVGKKNGVGSYVYNESYTSSVNLSGAIEGSESGTTAETEYIFGGGYEGLVCGNTKVYLGNGRIYDAFGGASNADILGHTEVYIGRQRNSDGTFRDGYPWIRDIVYGGNDFSGTIYGKGDFSSRIRTDAFDVMGKIHNPESKATPDVLMANAYVEYLQGRVDSIFGGSYGYYDYTDEQYLDEAGNPYALPMLESAFVHIRPNTTANPNNAILAVFGAGTGYPSTRDGDNSQDRSYVLIDIPDNIKNFSSMEVFGAGSYDGLGMNHSYAETTAPGYDLDQVSAIVDLVRGEIGYAYGGGYNEGVTRRTVVNVPSGSTINVRKIFGGGFGTNALPPCDVYESNVNYRSADAIVTSGIFGGNNNVRRTVYSKVNIFSPVYNGGKDSKTGKRYLGTIYGAGYGNYTWSEYTEVNLEAGARVYEVYGGGQKGQVLNAESVQQYMKAYLHPVDDGSLPEHIYGAHADENWAALWRDAWTLGDYFTPGSDGDDNPDNDFDTYVSNIQTNLDNTALVRTAEMDDRATKTYKYNTNVIIKEGATVENYAYGGGLGYSNEANSGDVIGSTYIALLGGTVLKDVYAAGTTGSVYNIYGGDFTATANAYIYGGSCRNVYGGGWDGNVGFHAGAISASTEDDVPAETHVVIGDSAGTTFTAGIPTIQRNAYGGGEGGPVYGSAYLSLYNGYIGYEYVDGNYVEKIEDDTYKDKETGALIPNTRLLDSGCIFGGGYVDNSNVDKAHVHIYGGNVRNSLFGGGEIAAIGRGSIRVVTSGGRSNRELEGLYRPGRTEIEMYGGHVHRNVFGGGRGFNNLGDRGKLNCDGYVFGQTEVHIHGGEIGTYNGVDEGYGNVFGGGDIGYVYSAYENADGSFGKGVKKGERYTSIYQGYYYQHGWEGTDEGGFVMDGDEYQFTEDCKVLISPHCRALNNTGTFSNIKYAQGERVPTIDYNYLQEISSPLLARIGADKKVTAAEGITFSRSYPAGSYVPVQALNTLGKKNADAKWNDLDPFGIIIHNAVFAGGNTSSGSTAAYANATSVYGNATASIYDVYHRDLITLGTGYIGGLYGEGNLTFVDGYRELNITNYGTDYYSIEKEITINQYHALPEREAAYYELKYKCIQQCEDRDHTVYKPADPENANSKASTIRADDYLTLFEGVEGMIVLNDKGEKVPNPAYWTENGVLPVYAGRLMNSIQRADFCGVYGSRMVMQGALDRVPEEVDHTKYTINRVREVSLNKQLTTAGDSPGSENYMHGNYFGIYNIVNFLGALTSDVDFGDETSGDVRNTDSPDAALHKCNAGDGGRAYGTATYYDWKKAYIKDRRRNNGSSHNKVALASGVYLELTTEESTGPGLYEKVWGPITGVIELDLINVSQGIGGGFVYAKNQHGQRSLSGHKNTTLTALNRNAVTQWDFEYDDDDEDKDAWESSGNFVHSTQTIIDDCYNVSNRYLGEVMTDGSGAMPCHYWYIKGSVYVYDQYISAYTGIPNAYSESVDIPLTITAASHGTIKLLNVQTNRYAYYSAPGVELTDDRKVIINDKAYYKNDPISYWDYYLLSPSERSLFEETTYVNCVTYYDEDGTMHEAGSVIMKESEFNTYKATSHTYNDAEGNAIMNDKEVAGNEYIFRLSNNVSHDEGYILTYRMSNPSLWDTWYTKSDNSQPKDQVGGDGFEDGPTYRLKGSTAKVLGQREYKLEEIISEDVYNTCEGVKTLHADAIAATGRTQATFERAYIVTEQVSVTDPSTSETYHKNPGVAVSATEAATAPYDGKAAPAFVCTSTIMLSKTDFIYMNTKMSELDKNAYIEEVNDKIEALGIADADNITDGEIAALSAENKKKLTQLQTMKDDIISLIVPAYYCTSAGSYGGNYYEAGRNYRGLEAWSSMSKADREYFEFNYDALDLLIDPNYSGTEGHKYQYDSEAATADAALTNLAHYSLETQVDYTATYNGDGDLNLGLGNDIDLKRYNETEKKFEIVSDSIISKDDELSREAFEALANEKRHYTILNVKEAGTYYVVNKSFQIGNTIYSVGETISFEVYSGLSDPSNVTSLTFGEGDRNTNFYFCREKYKQGTTVTPVPSSQVTGVVDALRNDSVLVGTIIREENYEGLPNQQSNFTIHGIAPTETSTLYVSRNSDIYDLSKERIITVIYQYDYEETQGSGSITPISERHVVNIHLQFKSGVPTVENINKPDIILPGDYVSLREPTVTPGAYEITGGGWELFEKIGDAESHVNGIEYTPSFDQLYWYQNDWYVAYYAKTYLGRTYSNAVPVSVANYHDLANVMAHEEHHMYIDNEGVKRDPKIYINDYSSSGKNGLDELQDLFNLSVLSSPTVDHETGLITSGPFAGHKPLASIVEGCANLEIIMRTDIDRPCDEDNHWTPIAGEKDGEGEYLHCFSGTLHGDGYTISGLDNSLFGHLCGNIYNLGVTGSFTSAGVADEGEGYVESCWINTTGTPDGSVYAVFGNPTRMGSELIQMVNCYYQDTKGYKTTASAHGVPRAKSDQTFYNGEVAYDLNNFYLYKRYCDMKVNTGASNQKYQYYTINADNTLTLHSGAESKYYASNPDSCSSGYNGIKYVEDRFADGDFRFAEGVIPSSGNERYYLDAETETVHYYPIYPDDYIFFGQKLTYGYGEYAHQAVPTAVVRDDGRLAQSTAANRVYRAPAYYGSKTMGVAHFNPHAYLANKSSDGTRVAYPGMTAIDFAGHQEGREASAYKIGLNNGWFYSPLLDDDGLLGIDNCDETQNLLVYAPAEVSDGYANKKTYDVLNAYFVDPAYEDYYDDSDYRCVDIPSVSAVVGHLVQSDLKATNDHLLVDKQDFNAPISYRFDSDYRMWYQRVPDNYVEPVWTGEPAVRTTKGWEGVSLPFSAELVTTNEKGEITHFYSGSESSKNGTGTKIGHEYWLREFKAINVSGEPEVATANFLYPSAIGETKTVTNTFLWDYYYENTSVHNQKDKNKDIYQTYYEDERTYRNYPFLASATPYIIGFPGATYYEFDLSGSFIPRNTDKTIAQLGVQTITFASKTGITIGVSDDETTGVLHDGYIFKPSYMKQSIAAGSNAYTLSDLGDSYDKVAAVGDATMVEAFRPYFTAYDAGVKKQMPGRIVFNGGYTDLDEDEPNSTLNGFVDIYSRDRTIVTRSYLTEPIAIRIVNMNGITVANYVLEPAQVVETPVQAHGVYIINKKKLFVK